MLFHNLSLAQNMAFIIDKRCCYIWVTLTGTVVCCSLTVNYTVQDVHTICTFGRIPFREAALFVV